MFDAGTDKPNASSRPSADAAACPGSVTASKIRSSRKTPLLIRAAIVVAVAIGVFGAGFGLAGIFGTGWPGASTALQAPSANSQSSQLTSSAENASGQNVSNDSHDSVRNNSSVGIISLDQDAEISPERSEHVPDVVLVSIREGVTSAEVSELLSRFDFVETADVSEQDLSQGFVEVSLAPGTDVARAVYTLKESGLVEGAQPNYIYHLADGGGLEAGQIPEQTKPNDPKIDEQWALEKVQAYEAWSTVKTEGAVTVAVVDNGCIVDHEDLKDSIVDTYNAVDADNPKIVSHPASDYHGTHVAGIVAGVSNNGLGISGVSYNARLLPIQIFTGSNANTAALATAYKYILEKADDYNIKVVNLSVGGASDSDSGSEDKLVESRIAEAYDKGIVTVCAACNNASAGPYKAFPVDFCDEVVGVINLKQDDQAKDGHGVSRASSSNYNMEGQTTKDIAAPGTNILSTWGPETNRYKTKEQGGTSMAAPVVSGILALEFAANPDLSAEDAVEALYEGAIDLDEQDDPGCKPGWDEETGYGMANALGAIKSLESTLTGTKVVKIGATTQLKPAKFDASAWKWSSSDDTIATVDENGIVTGNSVGIVTIKATWGDTTVTATVRVAAHELTDSTTVVHLANDTFTYAPGATFSPDVSVTFNGEDLKPGEDYTVAYAGNDRAGTATVIVTGEGDYMGGVVKAFAIEPAPISTASVVGLSSKSYTGKALHPEPELYVTQAGIGGGTTGDSAVTVLRKDSDYKLTYVNNVDVGTASVIITGKGNYTGTMTKTFAITQADISGATNSSIGGFVYSGKAITPSPTLKLNGVTLRPGTDYRLEYANNVNVGRATVTFVGKGNYAGKKNSGFSITKASLSSAVVSAISKRPYTGKVIKPSPTVSLNGKRLVNGVDYRLAYENNIMPGKARVSVIGMGNYAGTKSVAFTIVAPTAKYRANVAGRGWRAYVKEGGSAGIINSSRNMRAISAKLTSKPYSGSIKYRVRNQSKWLGWKSNGKSASAGSSSKKRVEAIQIKLTGALAAHYDVYYCVRMQKAGWSGWAKNGASAGSKGYGYRVQAYKIKIVPKGMPAPGKTTKTFLKR